MIKFFRKLDESYFLKINLRKDCIDNTINNERNRWLYVIACSPLLSILRKYKLVQTLIPFM